jgi:hypothetical protein
VDAPAAGVAEAAYAPKYLVKQLFGESEEPMRRIVFASAVVIVVALCTVAGLRLQSRSGSGGGGVGSVRARFDAAVARAQVSDGDDTLKLVYSIEDRSEDGLSGTMSAARRGGRYQITYNLSSRSPNVRIFAANVFGVDSFGPYYCLAPDDSVEDPTEELLAESGCHETEHEEGREGQVPSLLAGLDIAAVIKEFGKGASVEDAGQRTILGLNGDCFRIKSKSGTATVCLAMELGLLLSEEWEDGSGTMELKEFSQLVTDADLGPPSPIRRRERHENPGTGLTATKLFGTDTSADSRDGPCSKARTYDPYAIQGAPDGSLFLLDDSGLRKLTPDCTLTTVLKKNEDVQFWNFAFDKEGNRYDGFRYEGDGFRYEGDPSRGPNLRRVTRQGQVTLLAGPPCPAPPRVCSEFPAGAVPVGRGPIEVNGRSFGPMAVHQGDVYFAEWDGSGGTRLRRLNGDGTTSVLTNFPKVREAVALVVDSTGSVYVSFEVGGVFRISSDGTTTNLRPERGRPCMAIDALDRVWYMDMTGGKFAVFADGRLVAEPLFPMEPSHFCVGLAFLADGSLVMMEGHNAIVLWKIVARLPE